MRISAAGWCLLLAGCASGAAVWTGATAHGVRAADTVAASGWNRAGAARFLDAREVWWQEWPRAQKDHGTVCVSCHTQLPYAMARPALSRDLGEAGMTATQARMMQSVEARVNGWEAMVPFYSDAKNGAGKTLEARNTEAVLNAVILLTCDGPSGHLRPVTRKALENVWALQEMGGPLAGTWKWQNFHLGPWEGDESGYQGSALLMAEVLAAPDGYAEEVGAKEHVAPLRGYLRREYAKQPVMNQLYVLWASGRDKALLSTAERSAVLAKLRGLEQPDGGWRLMGMDGRKRIDDSPEPKASDGMATGLTVLALEEAGLRSDSMVARGVVWLRGHQAQDGSWNAMSINKAREPESDAFLFMTDAATAYAAMALDGVR